MNILKSISVVGLEQFNFTKVDCFDMIKFRNIFQLKPSELSQYLGFPRQQIKTIIGINCYKPRRKDHQEILKDFQKVLIIFLLLLKPEIKKDTNTLIEIISTWFKAPNPALPNFSSPIDLLAEGKGKDVIDVLNDELHSTYS